MVQKAGGERAGKSTEEDSRGLINQRACAVIKKHSGGICYTEEFSLLKGRKRASEWQKLKLRSLGANHFSYSGLQHSNFIVQTEKSEENEKAIRLLNGVKFQAMQPYTL